MTKKDIRLRWDIIEETLYFIAPSSTPTTLVRKRVNTFSGTEAKACAYANKLKQSDKNSRKTTRPANFRIAGEGYILVDYLVWEEGLWEIYRLNDPDNYLDLLPSKRKEEMSIDELKKYIEERLATSLA